ncbi:MAG: glycosyltransferase [Thermodesulfovibrionales bacterium]|nr:glycosyltransferase [Thermodesulfovibrionales bacterium]
MKALLIHNSHRSGSSSGDDIVFSKESKLLEQYENVVFKINPSNDEFDNASPLKKLSTILQVPWSFIYYKKIKQLLLKENPDIIHLHNFFPFISPSVFYAADSAGIPIIQTLHDFRYLCPMAFLMRSGKICNECKGGAFFKSVEYGCFKGSNLQSIPVAFMLKLHWYLKTFKKKIDGYICLTESQRKIYLEAGFDETKLFIKPNFVDDTYEKEKYQYGDYAVFIGRLGEEKGVRTLIGAWKNLPDIPLKIVGDGPDAKDFKSLVNDLNIKNIDFIGYKPYLECRKILNNARFLIMPSIWYETFGLTIIEAFSHCKPVIASNLGAMADIVKDKVTGLLFTPMNTQELTEKVRWLWTNPEECKRMGQNARREYEEKYTPDKNYEMLMDIYREVIEKTPHKTYTSEV